LTSKYGKSHFFQSNDDEIVKWINRDDMGVLQLQSAIKKQEKLGDATNEKNHQDYINKRKGFKILGKYTDEEIRKFFSFLYLEKSTENQPILSQDVVDIIFINGLTIPQEIPKEKYSLNKSPKYSRKFIDYALHLFFSNHSFTARDKKDFVLFFACYLQDYGNALVSDSAMNNIKSNMSGKKTQKMKIKWDDYLPKK
jgi:hypothetical protein